VKPSLPELLTALAPVVRPAMLEHFAPNCCIATCRTLRRALQHFGYEPEPIPCFVFLYNAAMVKLLAAGMQFPDDRRERTRLFELFGAWGVGILPESGDLVSARGGGYGGHVVLRVRRLLVDASIQQVERPDKKLFPPTFITCEPADEFFAFPGRRHELVLQDESHLVYQRSADYSFRYGSDWQRQGSPYVEVLSKIIRETKARLEERA
jgi:hypothetical protein